MTARKCASVLAAANARHPSPPRPPGSGTAPLAPKPVISCGRTFFSASLWATLADRFGNVTCFRFPGQRQWVVVGNGVSVSALSMAASAGGAIVAVENCSSNRCLDPDALRGFAGFTVTRAPDPGSFPLELEASFASRFLLVYNAGCGPFTFDVRMLEWHGGLRADVNALLSHPSSAAAIPVTHLTNGSQALSQARPASDRAACGK
jgi:hypothetical protein